MQDFLLISAGLVGAVVSLVHARIGARRLIAPVEGVSATEKRVLSAVFQLSSIYWFVGGLILLAAVMLPDTVPRQFAAISVAFLYICGSLGNCWATKGTHFGWPLLALAAGLALLGA